MLLGLFLLFLPLFLLLPSTHLLPLAPEPLPPDWPIWLAIERVLPSPEGQGDAVLVRPELCHRSCADLLGEGAEQVHRARCVCRCPPEEPVFVQQKTGKGKCVQKVPDCPGRPIFFEHPQHPRPLFVPAISLPQKGEPLAEELRIAWKASGVKVRQSQGPRCSIQSAFLLGNQSEWRLLDAGQMFELGWAEREGRVLWIGTDPTALAGGILRLELDCVAGKNGNATFCLAFRVEGQIEAAGGVGKAPPGAVGMELERGRRAEVVIIILLAILLFLSLFGSIFLWNVCWRLHKRKLVHSLQMQFIHFARHEKEKAISECQLRYQALVKAAAGMRNSAAEAGQGPSAGIGQFAGNGALELAENGGMFGGDGLMQGGQQNGRRKLYFSSAEAMMMTSSTAAATTKAEPPMMPLMAVYMRRCAQRKEGKSEFFEPQLMSHPPPMAEQFLFDLRKMISVARDRIRTRRHVPRLPPVVESEDEGGGAGPAGGGTTLGKAIKVEEKLEEEEKENINQEQRQGMARAEEGMAKSEEGMAKPEEVKPLEGEKQERRSVEQEQENNPSPRSSMDSGRGSQKQEEEGEEKQEQLEIMEIEQQKAETEASEEEAERKAEQCQSLEEAVTSQMLDTAMIAAVTPAVTPPNVSRIPVGPTNKSPRLQLKFTALRRRAAPPLPPRPPPPPPSGGSEQPEVMMIKPKGQNPLAAMKRRIAAASNGGGGGGGHAEKEERKQQQQQQLSTLAICPPPSFACSDRMKKSLPRRKKTTVVPEPSGIQLPPNTALMAKVAPTVV